MGVAILWGSECGDYPCLWPIVVQFCLWQWNDGGSWMGVAMLWIYAIQFQWLLCGTKALHRPVFARSVAIPEKSGKKTKQSLS